MKLQPLGDRVVVRPTEEAEARTPSGLVIPDTAKEKPQVGEVIAVGPGARDDDHLACQELLLVHRLVSSRINRSGEQLNRSEGELTSFRFQ